MPPKFLIPITAGDHAETHMPAISQFLPVFLYILHLFQRHLYRISQYFLKFKIYLFPSTMTLKGSKAFHSVSD